MPHHRPAKARTKVTVARCAATITTLLICSGCSNDAPSAVFEVRSDAPKAATLEPPGSAPARAAKDSFDPTVACKGELSVASIPKRPVFGKLSYRGADSPSMDFALVSGRVDVRDDRAALRLGSEELKSCSPLRSDGELAKKPRVGVTVARLEERLFTFPERGKKDFKYWNYVYVDKGGAAVTVNAFAADKGLLTIDKVDSEKKTVRGKMLLCRKNGQGGFVAGEFEVPICQR